MCAGNKAVVCALSASYISTFAGYPVSQLSLHLPSPPFNVFWQLDSIKSRLQTTKQRVSIPRLALTVYQEEGIVGFYRGLWIPLMTISFVRTCALLVHREPVPTHIMPFRCGVLHHLLPDEGILPRPTLVVA